MIAMTMLPDILAVGRLWEVVWVELMGSEACVWGWVYVLLLCGTSGLFDLMM